MCILINQIIQLINTIIHIIAQLKEICRCKVKSSTYIGCGKDINNEDSKFKIGDIVRISKYKNVFVKGYGQNWSEEVLETFQKVKRTVPWIYVISDLKGKEIVGTFYDKEQTKK